MLSLSAMTKIAPATRNFRCLGFTTPLNVSMPTNNSFSPADSVIKTREPQYQE